MPFFPLEETSERSVRGFVPLPDSEPKRGFTPLQSDAERPSIAGQIILNNPLTAIAEAGANLASQAVALPR